MIIAAFSFLKFQPFWRVSPFMLSSQKGISLMYMISTASVTLLCRSRWPSDKSHVLSTMLERSLIPSLTRNLYGNFELIFSFTFLRHTKCYYYSLSPHNSPWIPDCYFYSMLLTSPCLHFWSNSSNLWHSSRVQMHSHVKSQPCTDPLQHIQHTDLVT